MVHLGNHPELALCRACARWAAKQVWEIEDRDKTGFLVRMRDRSASPPTGARPRLASAPGGGTTAALARQTPSLDPLPMSQRPGGKGISVLVGFAVCQSVPVRTVSAGGRSGHWG